MNIFDQYENGVLGEPTLGAIQWAGGVVTFNALDNAQTGLRQLISGKPVNTGTQSTVANAMGSEFAGIGVDLALGFVNPGCGGGSGCGCGSGCGSSSYYCGTFGAPNFSASVWEHTDNGTTTIGGSASPLGTTVIPDNLIPAHGGKYHSDQSDHSGYHYAGGSNINGRPDADTGTTLETSTPLTTGKPGFTNYAYVNTESYLPPIPEVTVPEESSSSGSWFSLDSLQFGLDALGFVPGPAGMIADLANAGIHVARGNFSEAGWSVIGFVPIIGDSLKGTHTLKKTADITAGAVSQGAKHADDAAGLGKTTVKSEQKACIDGERKCKNGLEEQGQCFTEGTQIVVGEVYDEELCTTVYVTENIEDIEIGDLVYCYDTLTGEVVQSEVTETFALESDHINYLTIVDEDGNEQVIETTDSHPFWVVTDEPDLERAARTVVDENGVLIYHENLESNLSGFWVEAQDLQEGDVFLGANGELSTLVATERVEFPDGVKVYNFTVDGNHNYFVIAETDEFGQTSVLVHNMCGNEFRPKTRDSRPDNMKPGHTRDNPTMDAIQNKHKLTDGQRRKMHELMAEMKNKGETLKWSVLDDLARRVRKEFPSL